MIGVIARESERSAVREFFELFKTPWEFFRGECQYDVVLAAKDDTSGISAKLMLFYSSEKTRFDHENGIRIKGKSEKAILEYSGEYFPIYGKFVTFDQKGESLLKVQATSETAGIKIGGNGNRVFRIGFDLFNEIKFLLSQGQPSAYAHIPTLEIHISFLRECIVNSGIPLVEIPPTPAGCDFIACLTHDVDFVGIRRHLFDHTFFGFLYRALLGSLIGAIRGRTSWVKLLKNWGAVAFLPAVYCGVARDFWIDFDRYIALEKGLGSTFFLIPFKKIAGRPMAGKNGRKRASQYDIGDMRKEVEKLTSLGCEVGVHGIDAWCDPDRGCEELKRISCETKESNMGIRMHWLYYGERSAEILEEAGFCYDSSSGYNDEVGFRAGTTQVFRPPGAKKLLELPMHIQDTALFYPRRMGLTEREAMLLADRLLEQMKIFGGVLTINWHDRSLSPERLWDDFYRRLLNKLKGQKIWFGTGLQVVKWFEKRRSANFEEVSFKANQVKLRLRCASDRLTPDLMVRIYKPGAGRHKSGEKKGSIPFTGELLISYPI